MALIRHHQLTKYTKILVKTLTSPILAFFVILGNLILFSCMFVFYSAEVNLNPHVHSFFDALWWGMSTVSTVGYGDTVPVTIIGKIAGIVLMVLGGSFFAGVTALFVTSFVEAESRESEREIDRIVRHMAVIEEKLDRINRHSP